MKSNQGELYGNIQDLFQRVRKEVLPKNPPFVDKGHGRLETRECWVITDPAELAYVDPHRRWLGLKSPRCADGASTRKHPSKHPSKHPRGQGEGNPPFVLSLSKDPLSLDGRGLGEGNPPFVLSLSKDPLSLDGRGLG